MQINNLPILERAFQLASSGEVHTLQELALRLKRDGYVSVEQSLFGPSLRRELLAKLRESRR